MVRTPPAVVVSPGTETPTSGAPGNLVVGIAGSRAQGVAESLVSGIAVKVAFGAVGSLMVGVAEDPVRGGADVAWGLREGTACG